MYSKNKINIRKSFPLIGILLAFMFTVSSCDFAFDLPEAGSLADATPPSAAFGYKQNVADYLTIDFSNLSGSATDYSWDFGDGNTSNATNPSNAYATEGTYTVTLVATDKLNASSTTSQTIEVIKPISNFQPVILEPGFEDNSLPDGSGDGRDSWRNGDLGGVIQITSSPVYAGAQAAKFPSAGDRIAYQLITVEKNTNYSIDFFYTMKTSPVGSITVAVLAGAVSNPDDIAGATIADVVLTDQTSASDYVAGKVVFDSGDNTEIAIYVSNKDVECRIDDFSITKL
jgi:PKD repeat protein